MRRSRQQGGVSHTGNYGNNESNENNGNNESNESNESNEKCGYKFFIVGTS